MNQSEKRQFLIQSLLKERPEYRDLSIQAESESQRQLLRGLMNIRAPRRMDAEFLKTQDEYLQAETAAKGITDLDLFSRDCISGRVTLQRFGVMLSSTLPTAA